jgi:hypothetical protein
LVYEWFNSILIAFSNSSYSRFSSFKNG